MRNWLGAALAAIMSCTATAYVPQLDGLDTVARLELHAQTVKAAIEQAKHRPLQFAVGLPLAADVDAGSWDEPDPGVSRWRLRLASSDAASLSVKFEALQLPADAALYFYTAEGADVQGPYTADDNGALLTAVARSSDVVLEARMPSASRDAFALKLARAFHGYRDFTTMIAKGYPGQTGVSGACEVNVACDAGANYSAQIRATVLLTVSSGGSLYFCSGTLVNNAAQDDRPLVLTANHCLIRSNNVRDTTAYFNVQRSACTLGTAGGITQNIKGARLLAGSTGNSTDHTLFELAQVPPASYNAYYAGWEVSAIAPASGAVVHHPRGDDKKISTYTDASARDSICFGDDINDPVCADSFKVDAWEVRWARGTTEGGSSGSGLLNERKRIVGTLSGGSAACSGTSNNGQPDFFARLDKAWTASSSTGQTLKSALAGNSGCVSLDGKNPGAASPVKCGGGDSDGGGALDWLLAPLALAALWRRRRVWL